MDESGLRGVHEKNYFEIFARFHSIPTQSQFTRYIHDIPILRILTADIKPILAKLNEDTEFDVRYFADEAKQSIY